MLSRPGFSSLSPSAELAVFSDWLFQHLETVEPTESVGRNEDVVSVIRQTNATIHLDLLANELARRAIERPITSEIKCRQFP